MSVIKYSTIYHCPMISLQERPHVCPVIVVGHLVVKILFSCLFRHLNFETQYDPNLQTFPPVLCK